MGVTVKIKLLEGGKVPEYKTEGAACADCYAMLSEDVTIPSGKRRLISIGCCMEIPEGWEVVLRPRSGMTKIAIDNGLGTIDSDYRGEVKACVINNSDEDYVVSNGDRICQMKVQEAVKGNFMVVDELTETERGSGGFGHTGK